VIINIRPWSYKQSGSLGDTKERGLIGQYGLKSRGGLVRQLIRYPYMNSHRNIRITHQHRPRLRFLTDFPAHKFIYE
jgi:hypothetical protein